jgi:hypothetical protein
MRRMLRKMPTARQVAVMVINRIVSASARFVSPGTNPAGGEPTSDLDARADGRAELGAGGEDPDKRRAVDGGDGRGIDTWQG